MQGPKGDDANTNGGCLAPAGVPQPVIARLDSETNAALMLPEVRARLEAAGTDVQGSTPQDDAALVQAELAKGSKVIKVTGIQPDGGRSPAGSCVLCRPALSAGSPPHLHL